jgi:hypothetical protein
LLHRRFNRKEYLMSLATTREIEDRTPVPSARYEANVYGLIRRISEDVMRSPAAFTGLVAATPYNVSAQSWARYGDRHRCIRTWQRTSLDLLEASMRGEVPREIAASLLDDLPVSAGWGHHSRFRLSAIGCPQFFRTDEAMGGTVLEVQTPGSLWGVHEILHEFYSESGFSDAASAIPLSASFAKSLGKVQPNPIVHHLLDNSSHPAGERFFIHRACRHVPYFGYDPDVRPQHCNFVRAHDFLSLLTENFAAERIPRLLAGEPIYDLPPVGLFDQKALLAFPFWSHTRGFYPDAVRQIFPYTTLLSPEGVLLEEDLLSIEKFCKLPRRQRNFFLKYAGADVSRNWGSRAVYHLGKLSRANCETRLKTCLLRYALGERWILQREEPGEESVETVTREGELVTRSGHSKHSVFHGPSGPMAVLVMLEDFYKVHGSSETITTVGIRAEQGRDLHATSLQP